MGHSRGSELAVLAGAHVEGVSRVVAAAPSCVAWSGLGQFGGIEAAAWRLDGRDLPYVAHRGFEALFKQQPPYTMSPLFEQNLADLDPSDPAFLPVEAVQGPILLVSGDDDAMWPSTLMARSLLDRAGTRGFGHEITLLSYPDAGHAIAMPPEVPPMLATPPHPLTGMTLALGGTEDGVTAARAHGWPRIAQFLGGDARA